MFNGFGRLSHPSEKHSGSSLNNIIRYWDEQSIGKA